jgi:hypothetical protein
MVFAGFILDLSIPGYRVFDASSQRTGTPSCDSDESVVRREEDLHTCTFGAGKVERIEGPKTESVQVTSAVRVFGREADVFIRACDERPCCIATFFIGVARSFQVEYCSGGPLSRADADEVENASTA